MDPLAEFVLQAAEGIPEDRINAFVIYTTIAWGDTNDMAQALAIGRVAALDASDEEISQLAG